MVWHDIALHGTRRKSDSARAVNNRSRVGKMQLWRACHLRPASNNHNATKLQNWCLRALVEAGGLARIHACLTILCTLMRGRQADRQTDAEACTVVSPTALWCSLSLSLSLCYYDVVIQNSVLPRLPFFFVPVPVPVLLELTTAAAALLLWLDETWPSFFFKNSVAKLETCNTRQVEAGRSNQENRQAH